MLLFMEDTALPPPLDLLLLLAMAMLFTVTLVRPALAAAAAAAWDTAMWALAAVRMETLLLLGFDAVAEEGSSVGFLLPDRACWTGR